MPDEDEFNVAVDEEGAETEYSATFTPRSSPINGVLTVQITRSPIDPTLLNIRCRERTRPGYEMSGSEEEIARMGDANRMISYNPDVNTPDELGYWILHLMNNPDAMLRQRYEYHNDPEALTT